MSKNLGEQVRTGLSWDLTGTFFKQISTLIVTVILARILTPEEFGIIGMAMVFVSLSQVFVDVGFNTCYNLIFKEIRNGNGCNDQ